MKYYFEEDENKLIQNNNLDFFEKSFIITYPIITLLVFWHFSDVPSYQYAYLLVSHLFIYFFQSSLKNKLLFAFALFFGIVHFILSYFDFSENRLKWSLRATFFFVIFVQIIRFYSLKIQKREINIPSKFSSNGANFYEYILLLLYSAFAGLLNLIQHLFNI
jgi:hypothetical protein